MAALAEATDLIELYRLVRSEATIFVRFYKTMDENELCHQTFLRIWQSLGMTTMTAELPRPISRAYVRFALRSTLIDTVRADARLEHQDPPDLPRETNVDAQIDALQHLREVWRGLDENEQTLLRLLYVENMSQEQAAEIMGISHGTLRVRLSRLRDKLAR
jgi:RNA polymerase sigma-70 factor (ECF subfamily)